MEEELCYYRRLLFAGTSSQINHLSPPSSDTSVAPYTSNYNSNSTYATSYSPLVGTVPLSNTSSYGVSTPQSNASSSTTSSPTLSNIPGDFSTTGNGVDSYWGYDAPQTQGYQTFNTSGTSGW